MQLLTKEIIKWLPKLYETETEEDPMAWVKFFTPDSYWTWYILPAFPEHYTKESDKLLKVLFF